MSSGLREKAVKGAQWAMLGRLVRTFVGIGTLAVLSRFLGPSEFGIIALVTFVVTFAQVVADLGIRVALVQRKEVTALEQDSVFWFNTVTSTIVSGLVFAFAEPLARAMGDAAVAPSLQLLAPIFVVASVQGVSASVLERRFDFRAIAIGEMAGAVLSGVAAIVMVVMGYGLEALLAQVFLTTLIPTVCLILQARWRPRLRFSAAALRPLLSYGSYVTGTGLVNFLRSNIDRPIIGNRLSAADLGYLGLASQMVYTPVRIVASMLNRVMFPILASIQEENDRIRRGTLQVQHGAVAILAPVCLGLWAAAPPVTGLLFGPGWEMVAVLMGIMSVTALSGTIMELNNTIFAAKGHARFQFLWTGGHTLANALVILAFVDRGIVAVVTGQLLLSLAVLPVHSLLALRLIRQRPLLFAVTLGRPLLSAAVMAGAVRLLAARLPPMHPAVELAILVPLGVAIYAGVELVIDRQRIRPLAAKAAERLRRRAGRGRAAAGPKRRGA